MSDVRLRYVGPISPVDLRNVDPALPAAVHRGDEITVPAEVAGRGPHWRPLAEGEERHPAREYRSRGHRTEVHDLGYGLLAQLGNWEPINPTENDGGGAENEGDA